jgi:putative two-component system response regulator
MTELAAHGRILVVDDEDQIRRIFQRILDEAGYETVGAASAAEANALLRDEDFALVIADVNMPGESGIELVRHTAVERPGTATMVVSGLDDPGIAGVALEFGAYGYLTKPVRRADLVIATMNALRRRQLELASRNEREQLERAVCDRTASLRLAMERLDDAARQLAQSREETIARLARAIEFRDSATAGHVERMSRHCARLAARAGLDSATVRTASTMHDIGKIAVPDSILLKAGALTPEERVYMERHTLIGYDLLSGSSSDLLKLAGSIALTHHERVDGTGYPHGLAGEAIPIEGRIAAIADVFDALTTDRLYRPAFPRDQAIAMMRAESGSHFDSHLLALFLNLIDEDVAPDPREAIAL